MRLMCFCFNNNYRLTSTMTQFSTEQGFHFCTVNGRIVQKGKDTFNVLTPTVTVCVFGVSKETGSPLMALLTSDKGYQKFNGKYIDTSELKQDNAWMSLIEILRDKYVTTGNTFSVEFNGPGEVLAVSVKGSQSDPVLYGTVKGTVGEVGIIGNDILETAMGRCNLLKGFSFKTETPDIEKSISVKKSVSEIYKQIAAYLNKTLVLVFFLSNGTFVEQYISSNGLGEVIITQDYKMSCKRIIPTAIRKEKPFCIYTATQSAEDLMRTQSKGAYFRTN